MVFGILNATTGAPASSRAGSWPSACPRGRGGAAYSEFQMHEDFCHREHRSTHRMPMLSQCSAVNSVATYPYEKRCKRHLNRHQTRLTQNFHNIGKDHLPLGGNHENRATHH